MKQVTNGVFKKRVFYFDIIRAFACFCVIVLHSSAGYAISDCGTVNNWIGNIFDSLVRVAVPLFVMLTGALMLDEDYEYSDKKIIGHIVKIILFFSFWSFIYAFILDILKPAILGKTITLKVKGFIYDCLKGHYHLWFCFMIVGLYLIIPLLRLWVKKENKKQVMYFIILSAIFGYFIPSILNFGANFALISSSLLDIYNNTNMKYIGGFTVYLLSGWYIHNYNIKYKKILYIGGIVSVAVSVIGTYVLLKYKNSTASFYGNTTLHVFIQSCAVFCLIKNKCVSIDYNEKNKIHLFVAKISKYSLGIYAIHAGVLACINKALSLLPFNIAIVNILVDSFFVFVVSYILSSLFSRIPYLKKLV